MGIEHSSCLIIPLPVAVMPETQWWNTYEQHKPVYGFRLSFPTFHSRQKAHQPNVWPWCRESLDITISLTLVSNITAEIRGDGEVPKDRWNSSLKSYCEELRLQNVSFCSVAQPLAPSKIACVLQSVRSSQSIRSGGPQESHTHHSAWARLVSSTNCTASTVAFSKLNIIDLLDSIV